MPAVSTLRIDPKFVGPPGQGQGGYLAALLARHASEPVTVTLRAPIPFDTDLAVTGTDGVLELRDGDTLVAETHPRSGEPEIREAVSVSDAVDASTRCPGLLGDHAAPTCFSCGLGPESFRVHAGPVARSDVFATPWTPPEWSATGGVVDEPYLWAAMDCTAGWKVSWDMDVRFAFTGQISTDVLGAVRPGETYAVVAWAGEWKGRKRDARSAIFDATGRALAASATLWIAPR